MWESIMNDLKNSTLGERVLLGIIAGLFAVVGFYVGYEHLSHGVDPILIGSISAVVVMIGSMAAAFIVEELIRRIPSRKNKTEEGDTVKEPKAKKEKPVKEPKVKKEKEAKPSRFKKEKPTAETTETEKPEESPVPEVPSETKEAPVVKVEESTSNGQIKRMTLNPTLREQRLAREAAATPAVKPVEPKVQEPKEEVAASAESDFDGWDEEPVVAKKPVFEAPKAPSRPVAPKPAEPAPVTRAQAIIQEKARQAEEKPQENISLVDFIKAHPDLSARRMVKEYRLAGGTESTDNILELMN